MIFASVPRSIPVMVITNITNVVIGQESFSVPRPPSKNAGQFAEIGERMRGVRSRIGISQTEIAAELQISQAGYQYVESGQRKPSATFLARLKAVYGIEPEEILFGEEARIEQLQAQRFLAAYMRMDEKLRHAFHNLAVFIVLPGAHGDVVRDTFWEFFDDVNRKMVASIQYEMMNEKPALHATERTVEYEERAAHRLGLYRVAAGEHCVEPLELYETFENPDPIRLSPTDYFVLRVDGDSMSGSDINEGDYVLVRREKTIEPQQIAVVENTVDQKAVLKQVVSVGEYLVLRSTNPKYKDLRWKSSHTRPKGTFVRVLRSRR